MEWNVVLIAGFISAIFSVVFGYLGYQKGQKDESKKEGSTEGILNSDIKYIMRRTDEVLLEQKETNRNISAVTDRVTIQEVRSEEGFKAVNKRIDSVLDDFKECKRTKVIK